MSCSCRPVPPPLTSTSTCVGASASRKSPACAACSQGSPTTRDPQRADPSISAAAIARRYGTKSVDLRTTHAVPFVASQATSASRDGGGLGGSGSAGGPDRMAGGREQAAEGPGDEPVAPLLRMQP